MLSQTRIAIFIWPLLMICSPVISRSFITRQVDENEKTIWKRDIETVEADNTNSTKPDVYNFTVTSNIQFRYAVTTVSNRVANRANVSKEISFQVTLPDSAFISKFLMVIKDKVYEAYVKEKEEAKKDYDAAVESGYSAGLVAMNARDSNVFTVSANVEAQGKVTFNLTYEQLLTRTLGHYENLINVNPGQVVKAFNLEVNIKDSSNITSLHVSDLRISNEIDSNNTKNIDARIENPASNSARILWSPDEKQQKELSAEGVNGQFIVRYDVDHTSNPNQILVDEGYFVHFYAPTNLKTLPKHVLFVLDISGSMSGRKIEQLREALISILSDIGPNDFFSILLFSDAVEVWTLNGTIGKASPSWNYDDMPTTQKPEIEINGRFIVPATPENIKNATEFAKTLADSGGTNIIAGLRKSLEIATWGQKQYGIKAKPLIIFLTDGQPNVELSDPEEIIKSVKKLNPDKYPIFSLAFGQGADYDFLRKLSLSNAGFARNIYVASDTSLQLKNLYQEVASPLLSNVTFEYVPGQISEDFVTKRVFNNLFNGSELVVAGRLSNNTKELGGNVTFESVDGYFCTVLPPPVDLPVQKSQGHLEKLWAYIYIKELLDKDLISDEKNSTYKQKALKLSLDYGFVTPLTSLVVVKPNQTDSGASLQNSHPSANDVLPSRIVGGPIGLRGPSNIVLHQASAAQFSGAPSYAFPPSNGVFIQNSRPHPDLAFSAESDLDSMMPEADAISTTSPPTSTTLLTTISTAVLDANITGFSTPYNLSDIAWLQNKTEIKYPSSNNSYSVFVGDLPNTEYQSCLIPNSNNTLGHCRHVGNCVIPDILSSFEDFIVWGEQCVIDARFVGICCPKKLESQKTDNTTASTPITTPLPSNLTTIV